MFQNGLYVEVRLVFVMRGRQVFADNTRNVNFFRQFVLTLHFFLIYLLIRSIVLIMKTRFRV